MPGHLLADGYRLVRRLVLFTTGAFVVAVGALMIFLPGPALLVIPAGLAILALEFGWARRLLRRVREESASLWSEGAQAAELQAPASPDKPAATGLPPDPPC